MATEPRLGRRHDVPRGEGSRMAESGGQAHPATGFQFLSRGERLRGAKPSEVRYAGGE